MWSSRGPCCHEAVTRRNWIAGEPLLELEQVGQLDVGELALAELRQYAQPQRQLVVRGSRRAGKKSPGFRGFHEERAMGLEPTTLSLGN
jgi:hypothetical protein